MNEGLYIGTNVGNYSLKKLLGKGTYGEVYLAEQRQNRQLAAVKLMINPPPKPTGFLDEARTLFILKHEYILPIIDFDPEGKYIVTEYAPNGTLEERIKQYHPQRLLLSDALTIIAQVGKALHYAHTQNIVHRDLKPANILFNATGDALLADLGIAIALEAGGTVRVPYIEGTYRYMAPEQFNGEVSVRSDQYALGCISYELVTGVQAIPAQIPFNASPETRRDIWRDWHYRYTPEPPSKRLNTDLPSYVERAILKALEKNRANRHKSVNDFITALKGTSALSDVGLIKGAKLWRDEGNEHFRNKRYDEALKAYDMAIQLNPDDIDNYNSKGNVLFELRRYLEALDIYQKALQLSSPEKKDICYVNIGNVMRELKSYDEALRAYEMAIDTSPGKGIFYFFKGNILQEKKLFTAALAAYDHAIQFAESKVVLARFLTYKGEVLLKLRCYPEAFEVYREALKHNPNDVSIYLAQGIAFWKSSLYKAAIDVYEQGLKLYPDNIELSDRRDALKRGGRI